MRKLVYYAAVSLDGFIAGPAGEVDSFVYVGDHMTRMIEDYPETVPGRLREQFGLAEVAPRAFDTVLMGRATHQVAVDEGLSSGYPHLRQFVVTHRPHDLPAEKGLTVTDEDPVALVRRLKAEDSPLDIWLCGGGALAGQVAEEIDEFRLKVNPVVFGDGIPMLGTRTSQTDHLGRTGLLALPLRQRSRTDFASGVSYVEYVRD